MKNIRGWSLLFAASMALGGCQFIESEPTPAPNGTEDTGLALTVDLSYGDVEAIRFTIDTCDGDEVRTEDLSVDEGERFANYFASLDAGCYNVKIEPLDEDGNLSADCEVAEALGIEVFDGATTDLILVSQCNLDSTGGMDVLGVLNFAPQISMVAVDPATDIGCEAVEVCATAVDSDGDPIEFAWNQLEGPDPAIGPEIISTVIDNGTSTQCIEMTPGETGEFLFQVVAYDLIEDEDGDIVRIEEIGQRYDESFSSQGSALIPVSVECEEGVLGEVEDEKPKKDKPEEDVLGEVEDERDEKDKPEEDVLGEVEDEEVKKEKPEEEVLAEVEIIPRKYSDAVLAELEGDYKADEDILGEIEEEYKKERDEAVLGELENCTYPTSHWASTTDWPKDSDQFVLEGYLWASIIFDGIDEEGALWNELAESYVAARVNILAGAEPPKGVLVALYEAEVLLAMNELEYSYRLRARNLKGILTAFNNGVIGPGSC